MLAPTPRGDAGTDAATTTTEPTVDQLEAAVRGPGHYYARAHETGYPDQLYAGPMREAPFGGATELVVEPSAAPGYERISGDARWAFQVCERLAPLLAASQRIAAVRVLSREREVVARGVGGTCWSIREPAGTESPSERAAPPGRPRGPSRSPAELLRARAADDFVRECLRRGVPVQLVRAERFRDTTLRVFGLDGRDSNIAQEIANHQRAALTTGGFGRIARYDDEQHARDDDGAQLVAALTVPP